MNRSDRLITQFAADVGYLCSPALAGRLSGSPGALRAGDYLAQRLAAIGLQPDGDIGYWQPLQVAAARLQAPPRLVIAGRALQHRRDFAEIAPLSASGHLRADHCACLVNSRFQPNNWPAACCCYRMRRTISMSQAPPPQQPSSAHARY